MLNHAISKEKKNRPRKYAKHPEKTLELSLHLANMC